MTIELPDVRPLHNLSAEEIRLELACALYARGKLSAVGGSHLAGVDLFTFQGALKERCIPRNYSADDLHDDLETLSKLFPA